MTGCSTNDLANLASAIQSHPAVASVELTEFPAGGAMLDARRRDGRAFVLAASPAFGYAVDEIQDQDGLTTGYKYCFRDLEPAAHKLQQLVSGESDQQDIRLNLIVIRSGDLEASKEFYAMLGLTFRCEQHGQGPKHYAAELGQTVFEVYPCTDRVGAGNLQLGFRIHSLDTALDALRKNATTVLREPHDSPWGRRAVVRDPDGNYIELTEVA
jgi:predicted enzyme related to lactoylglutathione lyase